MRSNAIRDIIKNELEIYNQPEERVSAVTDLIKECLSDKDDEGSLYWQSYLDYLLRRYKDEK